MLDRRGRLYFYEEQRFRQPWVWALVLVPLLVFGYGFFKQIVLGEPWGDKPMEDSELIGVTAMLVLIAVWIYEMRLVTEVREDGVHYHFFLLWRRKILPFQRIKSYAVRSYNPIREYGGWGIRRGSGGWAYNVSGNRGVQFELTDATRLLIGSERPEEFARAVSKGMDGE